MHPIRSVFLALGLSCSLLAPAAEVGASSTALLGRVYLETDASKPAFTAERRLKTAGEKSVLTERFKDLDGKTVASMESTYLAGALQSIVFEQAQSQESASAVFNDGKVRFTHTENGSTKQAEQAVAGQWVALSAVPDEIVKNWDTLGEGKRFEFAMPVPIMRDHFNFTVARQRAWTENGRRLVEFKMQAASMLIRMMADAFYYVFDEESRVLVEYRGVTTAKMLVDGKLKDVRARITYVPGASGAPDATTPLAGQ